MRRPIALLLCVGAMLTLRFSHPAPRKLSAREARPVFRIEADLVGHGGRQTLPERMVVAGERLWLPQDPAGGELSCVIESVSRRHCTMAFQARDASGRERKLRFRCPLDGRCELAALGGRELLDLAGLVNLEIRHRPLAISRP